MKTKHAFWLSFALTFVFWGLIAWLLIAPAHAETILAFGASVSQMRNSGQNTCPQCSDYDLTERHVEPAVSVEVRGTYFGLALSYGEAERDTQAGIAKGINSHTWTPDPTQPQKSISQSISAQWVGLQGTYTVKGYGLGLRLAAGVAQVWGKNVEQGTYDGNPVYHENKTSELRPMYGIGLEKYLGEWLIRAEWSRIDRAVQSYWTESNRIDLVGLQFGRRF